MAKHRHRTQKGGSGNYSSASTYGSYVNGSADSQYARVFDQTGPNGANQSNVIVGAQGQWLHQPGVPSAQSMTLVQSAGKSRARARSQARARSASQQGGRARSASRRRAASRGRRASARRGRAASRARSASRGRSASASRARSAARARAAARSASRSQQGGQMDEEMEPSMMVEEEEAKKVDYMGGRSRARARMMM